MHVIIYLVCLKKNKLELLIISDPEERIDTKIMIELRRNILFAMLGYDMEDFYEWISTENKRYINLE